MSVAKSEQWGGHVHSVSIPNNRITCAKLNR